jgi:hypothetical protein
MRENKKRTRVDNILFFVIFFLGFAVSSSAEISVTENKDLTFSISPYFRTNVVTLKNNIDLDSKNSDDSTTYLGIDYNLGLGLKFKDDGPEAYLKLERNGPYDYDAPVFIHNTLQTSTDRAEKYRDEELLPHVEEFWYDFPLYGLPLRFKAGLFIYEPSNDIGLSNAYENYSFSLYGEDENLKWKFYYCRPDLANRSYLGPRIRQEREQGIHYTPNKANFFAADAAFTFEKNSLRPYVEVLIDHSGDNRANLFSTPTHKDLLGTFGLAWGIVLGKLSLNTEGAMNFGKAKTSDSNFRDVEHRGYMISADAAYEFGCAIPHSRLILASGNKVTTEMVDNGDSTLTSGKNRAFSSFSPLNANLSNSIYPEPNNSPFVAMGGGYGLNYGINRPTTFGDPRLFENMILFNLGFDYNLTDKLSLIFDWWYLRAMEKGVGVSGTVSKQLSPDLGDEVDLSLNYQLNKNVSLSILSGYFFPGRYYKEIRDDEDGSLFTPFVRGDGEADGAYQIEFSMTLSY